MSNLKDMPYVTVEQVLRFRAEALAQIDSLQQQLKQREWISVDDRLPEDCVTVLVHGGCAHYSKANGKWYTMMERLNNGDYRQISWIVTHWMPLPTPPKEQT
tara:strand:+ start:557 stop:862 length:306 start_codon:yes stop_codon:yes gene_type:complete